MQPESLMRSNFAELFLFLFFSLYMAFTLSSLLMHYISVTDFVMLDEVELNMIASKKFRKWRVRFVSLIGKASEEWSRIQTKHRAESLMV